MHLNTMAKTSVGGVALMRHPLTIRGLGKNRCDKKQHAKTIIVFYTLGIQTDQPVLSLHIQKLYLIWSFMAQLTQPVIKIMSSQSVNLLTLFLERISALRESRPRWLSWMRRLTGDQEVAGSTPAEVGNILSWRLIVKYFLRSFSPFR